MHLNLGWRFMVGIGAVPSVLLSVGVLAMPESPRWLVLQGRIGEAKRVLLRISESKEEAELRLTEIKEAAGIPLDCEDDVVRVSPKTKGEGVWRDLLVQPTHSVRHVLISAIGLHFFQQASGIDAVVLYSPRIFEKAGITSSHKKLLATVAVGFIKTLFILVATFLLDRVGRRPLLLSSLGGMMVSLLSLGVCLTVINNSHVKIMGVVVLCCVSVLSFVASFSIGMGPITWVYASEIFPLRLRAQGCAMGVGVNRVMSGVISMTFISLYEAITIGGAFLLFAGVATLAWIFVYVLFPETQGRCLEDMEKLFGNYARWKNIQNNRDHEVQMEDNNGMKTGRVN